LILILISAGLALYFRFDYNPGKVLAGAGPEEVPNKSALTSLISEKDLSENEQTSSVTQTEVLDTSHSIEKINDTKKEVSASETNAAKSLTAASQPNKPIVTTIAFTNDWERPESYEKVNPLTYLASIDALWLEFNKGTYNKQLDGIPSSSLDFTDFRLKDDYAKPANLGFGAHVTPGITIYDPNPDKYFIGADITANYFPSRWLIQAGVGYHLMQDLGEYEINYKTWDSIGYYREVTSFEFVKDNPDSLIIHYTKTTVYDSIPNLALTERNNKYSYLTFPVHLGYRFYENNRFSIYAKAGMVFSLLVAKNEPVVDVNISDASQIRIEKQIPARVKTNWHYTLGIQFGFKLGNDAILSVEPYFGQYLNSVYQPSEGYTGKNPSMFGLRTGIDLKF
jgi:hypothetical protein